MRILYAEMAFGFGGSLTGLLQLIEHLPPDVEPVLITGFDARKYIELPTNLSYEFADIASMPQESKGLPQQLAHYYRHFANPWMKLVSETVRRYRPDLIHTANSAFCNAPAAFIGRRQRIPTIGYQKEFEYGGRLNRFVLARGFYRHHIASSTSVADRLFELGLPRDRCTVMYEPVVPPRDEILRTNSDSKPPLIAMYSILQPWKGQDIFLQAIAKVVKTYREPFKVVVAGDSPNGEREYPEGLRRLASELGIADRIEFRGHVRQIFEMLAETDIAVHGSVKPEPFGRVIGEAMSAGVAVIATKGGGAAEIVQHEQTGLHVPMGDSDALAEAITRLLSNPDLRRSLGERARRYALHEFQPALHASKVVALYRQTLN